MSNPGGRSTLPLPVARLAVRSRNAKSSKDRHDTAWYAWEVSIKLAVAAAPPSDVARLARGSIGTWRAALRPAEVPLGDPKLGELHEWLAGEGEGPKPGRSRTSPAALLDALVAYRNRVLGHGATREPAFYERAAGILLDGLEPAWSAGLFLPREAQLLYCEAIVLGADGSRLGRILDLSGPDALVEDPRGSAVPGSLLPRRLYLRTPVGWRDVHPWLVYREGDSREREALYCFNGIGPTLTEFLDYASGETLRNEALEADWPGIVSELRRLFPKTIEGGEPEAPHGKGLHRLGDHVILGKLGQGGMGEVYLARQEPIGRLVALKTLSRERAQDPVSAARFRQEMQALARSEHPNVVKILGSGEADGVWYYAMEYVEGADLERVAKEFSTSADFERAVTSACETLREERRTVFGDVPEVRHARVEGRKGQGRYKDLARFFRDAARGLHHLHEKGVLHRDVKPANLMVTAAGRRAVVMDLGVAALEGGTISIAHDRSRIVGTLRYMAPEQLQRSLVAIDRRADVYSLGASLYELLCDRRFFEGDTEARLIEQVLKEEPHPIERMVPEDLARIVRKATDKDPGRRYETAETLAQDLENYLAGMPVTARDPDLGYLIRKWVERNRPLALAIVTSVLLLAATITTTGALVAAKNRDLEAANAALKIKTSEAEDNATETRDQAQRADREAETARKSERIATERANDLLRLSALQKLDDLTTEAERLWPARPENITRFEDWIERGRELVKGLPDHRQALAELGTRGLGDQQQRWWQSQLEKLIAGIEQMEQGFLSLNGVVPGQGLGIPGRLTLAMNLRDGFAPGGEYAEAWERDLPTIRAAYPGLELTPQFGLVPLGPDPASGLWEFGDLLTGELAVRGSAGGLLVSEATGLVFVLLPGDVFPMGAQRTDAHAQGYYLRAVDDEQPVRDVTLSPFFLSKYEMTQAQWKRVTGSTPATYGPQFSSSLGYTRWQRPFSLQHPVEKVSWIECHDVCARLGLVLPTEAQWEYAVRGGTTTPWWMGEDPLDLAMTGNVLDRYAYDNGANRAPAYAPWDDGATMTAPSGSWKPNPFGLHEMLGNVYEWCLDGYAAYEPSPGTDPVAPVGDNRSRVRRGGSWKVNPELARSACRGRADEAAAEDDCGLRPARLIEP